MAQKEKVIKYPSSKLISIQELRTLLDEGRILLLDVRNRTELVSPGQIPGSVCVPLHEVDVAFGKLTSEEFLERQVKHIT